MRYGKDFLQKEIERLTQENSVLQSKIEKLTKDNNALRSIAYKDSLTGAFNRNYLNHVLKNKYDRINCYLAFVDLNNLKQINDIFVHEKGDELIVSMYKKLTAFGEVVRLGGDEFAVFIDKNDPYLIKELIARALHDDEYAMGIVEKSERETVSGAMKRADELMYVDKLRIKNKGEVDKKYVPLKLGETLTDDVDFEVGI